MSFTKDDLREIKRAVIDMTKSINCVAQIETRPVCLDIGLGATGYAIFQIGVESTSLLRIEDASGNIIEAEAADIIECPGA